jgi:sulfide:quinone oxidoreductase
MDIRKIDDDFSVCPQIATTDIPTIAAMGFKSVLCNRPDGEGSDQTLFEAIETAAQRASLAAAYVPVPPTGPGASQVVDFARVFATLPKPVLAYCRTGNRSVATWQASGARSRAARAG